MLTSALSIVQNLGHLPLAVDIAGAFMEMMGETPIEFLENYKKNSTKYLDPDLYIQERIGNGDGKTVFTVWDVSFDRIKLKNPLAISLIQAIAFLYPDNISLKLFGEHRSQVIFQSNGTISPDDLNLAVQILEDFSLIRRTTRDTLS